MRFTGDIHTCPKAGTPSHFAKIHLHRGSVNLRWVELRKGNEGLRKGNEGKGTGEEGGEDLFIDRRLNQDENKQRLTCH